LALRNPRTSNDGNLDAYERRAKQNGNGYSLIEILFVLSTFTTLAGITVPPILHAIDGYRAAAAARYVSAVLQRARMEAVRRSADVAVRVTEASGQYSFAMYVDGNANGVLARDIASGVDRPLGSADRLGDHFAGVEFGSDGTVPGVDGSAAPGTDPIRLGTSNEATFTPRGSSSSGSLYVRSRTRQYVVRIYGDTGKTRVLRFDPRDRTWRPI